MLQEAYQPNGWLGMILGTRLWRGFFGSTLESDAAFQAQVDAVCKEFNSVVSRRKASVDASPPPPPPPPPPPELTDHTSPRRSLSLARAPAAAAAALQPAALHQPSPPPPPSPAASAAAVQAAPSSNLDRSSAAVIAWANQLGSRIEAMNENGLFGSGAGAGAGAGGHGNAGDAVASGGSGISPVLTAARDLMADCVALAAMADSMTSDEALAAQINRMFARSGGYGGK